MNYNPSDSYKKGEWDMFALITGTYYGKQYYFLEQNGAVYSRASNSYMSREEAYYEFLNTIGYTGD